MASLNKTQLIGNLGKDPEIRTTQQGKKIANLTIATSESWTDKASGERKERTEWHRVTIMNDGLAGVAERFLSKGSKVYICGSLQTRKWTDQSGQERYTTEIVLSSPRHELIMLDGKSSAGQQEQPARQQPERQPARPTEPDLDDEVPF